MKPTLADLRKAVDIAKKHSVKPRRIETQEDLEYVLAIEEAIGLKPHGWKIGDEYYEFHMHPEVVKEMLEDAEPSPLRPV